MSPERSRSESPRSDLSARPDLLRWAAGCRSRGCYGVCSLGVRSPRGGRLYRWGENLLVSSQRGALGGSVLCQVSGAASSVPCRSSRGVPRARASSRSRFRRPPLERTNRVSADSGGRGTRIGVGGSKNLAEAGGAGSSPHSTRRAPERRRGDDPPGRGHRTRQERPPGSPCGVPHGALRARGRARPPPLLSRRADHRPRRGLSARGWSYPLFIGVRPGPPARASVPPRRRPRRLRRRRVR